MKALLINGSPNKHGNTAALAAELLKGQEYETLNLTDYTIGTYGQELPGDGLNTVIEAMEKANVIVVGSPVYWHNICGSVRNVLDRFYGRVETGSLKGRKLYFVFQGAAPEKWMLEAGDYTMGRFAGLYGMTYGGMATSNGEERDSCMISYAAPNMAYTVNKFYFQPFSDNVRCSNSHKRLFLLMCYVKLPFPPTLSIHAQGKQRTGYPPAGWTAPQHRAIRQYRTNLPKSGVQEPEQ